jgi:glucosamine--fructose-6-phosphate aminotransferase (isomerizing)
VSWLEQELREQPAALARLLERRADDAARLAAAFRRRDVRYILIASRGSSSNAARYAQYLLGRAHRVPVVFATPSLYTLYGQPPRLAGALVVGISQSGESPDVCAVVEEARRSQRPTLAITNAPESPLAHAAEAVLPIEAGDEHAVAATKTYVNSLGAIALLYAEIADDDAARAELARMPHALAEQIELSLAERDAVDGYRDADGATVVARGINYCTAFEVALKIRELAGLLVEPYSAADLLHGPIAAIADGWPVVLVAPSGPARASVEEIVPALRERGARLLVVADDDALLARAETPLRLVGGVPEWLSPLTAVVPGQAAALRLAELRGLDLDSPRGLHKVTLTH